jgi:Holliday junction resolvase RusA-like endonuclease
VTNATAKAYKQEVAVVAYQQQKAPQPVAGPVKLWLTIYRPRPKGDLDNCLKILLDALQGILYRDDAQIVQIHAERFDAPDAPRVEVACQPA